MHDHWTTFNYIMGVIILVLVVTGVWSVSSILLRLHRVVQTDPVPTPEITPIEFAQQHLASDTPFVLNEMQRRMMSSMGLPAETIGVSEERPLSDYDHRLAEVFGQALENQVRRNTAMRRATQPRPLPPDLVERRAQVLTLVEQQRQRGTIAPPAPTLERFRVTTYDRVREENMPRAVAPAPPRTAASIPTSARVPTPQELTMVDQATAYLASKLVAALSRNRVTEQNLVRETQRAAQTFIEQMARLTSATDAEFTNVESSIRVARTNFVNATTPVDSYFTNARSSRPGRASANLSYLTRDFLHASILSLCATYEGFHWDDRSKVLSAHTEFITLSATIRGSRYTVPLGRFKMSWDTMSFTGSNGDPGQFSISSLDPGHHAHGHTQYIHPHVSGTNMCPGNEATGIRRTVPNALNGGRIADAFEMVDGLLHNYGSSPYYRLEDWGNHLCPGCNASAPRNLMVTCFQCNTGHCRACSQQCPDCNRWFCKDNCGTYDEATRTYSCPCNRNTVRCNGCLQRFDPTTPAGRIEPNTGYCRTCLFEHLEGRTPQPSPGRTQPTPAPAPAPVPAPRPAPAVRPAPTPQPIPAPVPSRRRSGQFDGDFDDLLDGQEELIVNGGRTEVITPTRPGTPLTPAQIAAQRILEDMDGEHTPVPLPATAQSMMDDLNGVADVPENTIEPLSPSERVEHVMTSPPVQHNAPIQQTPAPVVGNVNRYRDPVSGRWVTR